MNDKQKRMREQLDEIEKENGRIRVRRTKRTDNLVDEQREAIKKSARFPTYASRAWFRGKGSGRKRKNRFAEKMAVPKQRVRRRRA